MGDQPVTRKKKTKREEEGNKKREATKRNERLRKHLGTNKKSGNVVAVLHVQLRTHKGEQVMARARRNMEAGTRAPPHGFFATLWTSWPTARLGPRFGALPSALGQGSGTSQSSNPRGRTSSQLRRSRPSLGVSATEAYSFHVCSGSAKLWTRV